MTTRSNYRGLATALVIALVAFLTYASIAGIYYMARGEAHCTQFTCD